MKIIFAQGNPGKEYVHTRHNVGFLTLDHFAATLGIEFTKKPKFHAEVAETTIEGERILLVKPTTFYNETGQSARLLIDFYKLAPARDLLVLHDDLALPFGAIRTRFKGSDAGNNGVKSLNAYLGQEYARIRVGIYSEHRDRINDVDFVLGIFSAAEKKALPDVLQLAEVFIYEFVHGSFTATKKSLAQVSHAE